MTPHRLYAIIENHVIWNIRKFKSLQEAMEEARFYYADNPDAVECTFYPCEEGDKYINGTFYHFNRDTQIWEKINKVASYEDEIEFLNKQVRYLESLIIPSIDINDCTVNELKEYTIDKSKRDLHKYLLENPLVSSCYNDQEVTYSITEDEYKVFCTKFSTYMALKAMGTETTMTWTVNNELVEWTHEDILQFYTEWTAIMESLIAAQKQLEKAVIEAAKRADVLEITVDYSKADPRSKAVQSV